MKLDKLGYGLYIAACTVGGYYAGYFASLAVQGCELTPACLSWRAMAAMPAIVAGLAFACGYGGRKLYLENRETLDHLAAKIGLKRRQA